jgi:hypothetical protein
LKAFLLFTNVYSNPEKDFWPSSEVLESYSFCSTEVL